MSNQIFAKIGPVAVTVVGASAGAVSLATVMVALGSATALVFAGYGAYRLLAHSTEVSPKGAHAAKAEVINQWSRLGRSVLDTVPVGRVLKMAATGKLKPTD